MVVHVPAADLRALATEILVTVGAAPADAAVVAASLVRSNLLGHDSHGVRRLPTYLDEVRAGRIDPAAHPMAERTRAAAVVVHCRRAFGQLAASRAVEELRAIAPEHGCAVATIRECNHIGRLGEYVGALAEDGLVALAFGNADPTVAPFGGRERRLGTNPLAWAAPRAEGAAPVVMDWATSSVAEGKLAIARDRGEEVTEGLLLDAHGRPSTRPAEFYAGGALLPFGGHKGYGLSVLIEIVGGLLSGVGIGSMPGYAGGFGTVLVAVDVAAFAPPEDFRARVEEFCGELSRTPPAEGHREVLVPGDPEQGALARRGRDGIPIGQEEWLRLQRLRTPAADEPKE